MRIVEVHPPSFPNAATDCPITPIPGERWQVLCGDTDHWRCGVYSPAETSLEQCRELEQHTCPELFLLMSGRVSLAVWLEGAVRELVLPPGKPVLVVAPHAGFCPDGPHSGTAFVVERDQFQTEYRAATQW